MNGTTNIQQDKDKLLKEQLEKLKEFEEFLKKGKEITIQNKTFKVTISRNVDKEHLLNLVRSLKGLIHLSLNVPNENTKDKIQQEILNIVSTLTNSDLMINQWPNISAASSFHTQRTYGFQINYTKQGNTISASVTLQNDKDVFWLILRILGIYGTIEESLMAKSDVLAQIESYKAYVEKKLQELEEAKEKIESLIKGQSLGVFSKEFNKKAWWLWPQIIVFIILTSILFYATFQAISYLSTIQSDDIHTLLIRSTIVFVLGGISFYLLRYTINLLERKDEYRYKALVLSTFPALNYFLEDDKNKYELIKSLILENQRLRTLSSKEERLPLEEIAKLLSVLKSGK